MKLPQFTTRDLLLAVTLISAGLGCLVVAPQLRAPDFLFAGLVGLAFLGAGACAPFHQKALGIVIAVVSSVVLASGLAIWFLVSLTNW